MQAVGPLPAKWWPTAIQFHIHLFYTIPINGKIAPTPEAMCHHSWTLQMCSKCSAIVQHPVQHVTPSSANDSDVDIPSVDSGQVSSPILSLPNKVPHTGCDGILCTHTKDSSEYKLKDTEDMEFNEVERVLYEAIKIVREQLENPDPCFVSLPPTLNLSALRTQLTSLIVCSSSSKHITQTLGSFKMPRSFTQHD
ncbi:uncharacterized protein TRAVEDRAFT_52240 [Trametes versicolor FP-101664 SS1]|uniref:uncharacterized protein n=1 Tax=Trametes versicolor (strain FP-101664) TaxID=717944 RepID=UPI00046234A5|nr:uncharacterized protein TRAVEDRAFT_52240 [Trametes versicolor FP-101664 SS1]EIW54534.1 hypothetical protein TRAVEDRAFT_52240 [Trametes versicolor FP-101664 SS1]